MTTAAATPGYSHTQTAPLCLILYTSAPLGFGLAVGISETPGLRRQVEPIPAPDRPLPVGAARWAAPTAGTTPR